MLRRNTNYILGSFLMDWGVVFIAIALAGWLRFNLPWGQPLSAEPGLRVLLLEAGLLYPLIFGFLSIYDPERIFRAVDEYQFLSVASLIAGLGLAGLVYFTEREISRLTLVYFYAAHFILLVTWRSVNRVIRKGRNGKLGTLHRVLLIGGGEPAKRALDRLDSLAWAGVQLVGYLTDGEKIPSANGHISQLGGLQAAESVINRFEVDDVLLALPAESYAEMQNLVMRLIDKPCNLWVAPDYFSLLLYGSRVKNLGGVSMISLKTPALSGYQRVVKRACDLVLGTLLLILNLPLMGIIALAIKLDSSGPVIFRQRRVGENSRGFWMYKFRTMVIDAERRLNEVLQRDGRGNPIYKRADDPRVTRIGKLLRRTSLDELPQLFNVLRGEMSLVGPRPEMPLIVEQYEPWQHQRLAVPPGITGWWQVNGRSDKPLHLHTKDDLYYVQHYSLLLDLQILMKTVWVVLRGRGAY